MPKAGPSTLPLVFEDGLPLLWLLRDLVGVERPAEGGQKGAGQRQAVGWRSV